MNTLLEGEVRGYTRVACVYGHTPLWHIVPIEASVPAWILRRKQLHYCFCGAAVVFRRRERQRRMHPITSSTDGQSYSIIDDLRVDNAKFFNYFRMSQESFNELLTLLGPYMQKANTNMSRSIPAEERLAVTCPSLSHSRSCALVLFTKSRNAVG
ncbi:hypothetical protein O3P69_013250 [Scylla paramamosain]|uniref:Uncharacterized protein n=1 Tax=Scylla paramamosain TaxID=85552 RepID=A0AAW0U0Q2_SCYPA